MFDGKFFVLYKELPGIDPSIKILSENNIMVFFDTKEAAVKYMNNKKFSYYKICISVVG